MKTKKRKPRTWLAWAAVFSDGRRVVKQKRDALVWPWLPTHGPFRVRVTEIKPK